MALTENFNVIDSKCRSDDKHIRLAEKNESEAFDCICENGLRSGRNVGK